MPKYVSDRVVVNTTQLGGGLNDTAGPLNLKDNESSDLSNVVFNRFGSVLSRRGYTALNTSAVVADVDIDGLWWYQSSATEKAMMVAGDKVYKMDDLDGTWDNITGSLTITAGNKVDWENFLDIAMGTNNVDLPFEWDGGATATAMTVPTGLTKAKFVKQFENYTILANVEVSGTRHGSRFYWSTILTNDTWNSADYIDVEKNDGQQITGCKVLGDGLYIFKERKIVKYVFTGDRDVPFVRVRTASSVGCAAPYSVQEVNNGLVFLSYDGVYYFDGNNSTKLSDRINNTVVGLNRTKFTEAVSLVYKDKNQYWLSVASADSTPNDTVLVGDYALNSWSKWSGLAANAMSTFWVSDVDERPYFGDYDGFVYRADQGVDDYPLNVQTAIDKYYYTNWRTLDALGEKKALGHVYLYYQYSSSVLTLAYSYDFETNDTYSQTFSLASEGGVYGTAVYGTDVYGGEGGNSVRRDTTGEGRVYRLKVANSTIGEQFQIDGIGQSVNLETDS